MDWKQSKLGYYADFVIAPLVALAACLLFYHGGICSLLVGGAAGAMLWTFVEYWTHRVIFHRVFHEAHELHHRLPAGFVAAPVWLTAPVHLGLVATFTQAGDFGLGALLGLESGYLAYIVLHDRMHHMHKRPNTARWFGRRWRAHAMHHHGLPWNFGVTTAAWDRVFRTYWNPDWKLVRVRAGGVDEYKR